MHDCGVYVYAYSNEPGYYEDGAFGIRIENLVVVKDADTAFRFGGQSFFRFERLTMCPMSTKLMDTSVRNGQRMVSTHGD